MSRILKTIDDLAEAGRNSIQSDIWQHDEIQGKEDEFDVKNKVWKKPESKWDLEFDSDEVYNNEKGLDEDYDDYDDDDEPGHNFRSGQRVKFAPDYAGREAGEVFTLTSWDGESGRIADKQGRGWNVRGYQIVPVDDYEDDYEDEDDLSEGAWDDFWNGSEREKEVEDETVKAYKAYREKTNPIKTRPISGKEFSRKKLSTIKEEGEYVRILPRMIHGGRPAIVTGIHYDRYDEASHVFVKFPNGQEAIYAVGDVEFDEYAEDDFVSADDTEEYGNDDYLSESMTGTQKKSFFTLEKNTERVYLINWGDDGSVIAFEAGTDNEAIHTINAVLNEDGYNDAWKEITKEELLADGVTEETIAGYEEMSAETASMIADTLADEDVDPDTEDELQELINDHINYPDYDSDVDETEEHEEISRIMEMANYRR